MGVAYMRLDVRCQSLAAAGISDEGVRWTDCVTGDGSHLLQEHSDWGMLEAEYLFTADAEERTYQGGWAARLGLGEQELRVPGDCVRIINVGKHAGTKYIVCESEDGTVFMREFSDWGLFEATYEFQGGPRRSLYQGGWRSRLGGEPAVLPLPEPCEELLHVSVNGDDVLIDCRLPDDTRLLQEYTPFGYLQATYIFGRGDDSGVYQGGWVSRLGGEPQRLTVPAECDEVVSLTKWRGRKLLTCAIEGHEAYAMYEFRDWGLLEAEYRIELW